MSITYNVQAGDTFEVISRRVYGSELGANNIRRANPGAVEPLVFGIILSIPELTETPGNIPQEGRTENPDEVAILIDGERFRFWESVRITRSIDAMDTVEFGAPFDVDLPGFKETFRPFTFRPVEVTVGGALLFTGTAVGVNPNIENNKRTVTVSAYSKPGILNDCTPSVSAFPLEYSFVGLRDIAIDLAAPFGISVIFDVDQGPLIETIAINPGTKILSFLTGLAKQRNLIIASTTKGDLIFWKSLSAGVPRASFVQGVSPLLSVTPFFSPQEYYSHVSGIVPVLVGILGTTITVKNPRLQGVSRPFTFELPDTLASDGSEAVAAKIGRMFGNMANYSIRVATWRDSTGRLWEPNTTISLDAPDAMVYDPFDFIIRSVEFNRDSKSETATLDLVIPGAFSGEIPEALPWDL